MAETLTPNFQLSMFEQGDNPGSIKLNNNWENIDEIMADAAAGIATLEDPSYITFANEPSLPNSKRLTGASPNQVIVSDGGSEVFLSLPQNIHSGADVTFTSLTLNGGLSTPFISMSGYMEFSPDNTHDLTLVGGRPRDIRAGRDIYAGASFIGPLGTVGATSFNFGSVGTGLYSGVSNAEVTFAIGGVRAFAVSVNSIELTSDTATIYLGAANDVRFAREAAGIGKLTNGASACSWRVHGDATKYLRLQHDGTDAEIGSTSGNLILGPDGNTVITFRTNGTSRFFGSVNGLYPNGGNAYDCGDAANTWRTVYAGTGFIGPIGTVGAVSSGIGSALTGWYSTLLNANVSLSINGTQYMAVSGADFYLTSNAQRILLGAASDLVVRRAAADTWQQSRTTNGQTSYIYGTTDSDTTPANYGRLACISNNAGASFVVTQRGGTVATQTLTIGTAGLSDLYFRSNDTARWTVGSTGNLYPNADNTYTFGGSANRISSGYFGTAVIVGTNPAAAGSIRLPNASVITARNALNTADAFLLYLDGSNVIQIGNDAVTAGIVLNENARSINTRIESGGDANMVLVDGTNNRLGIRNSSPGVLLHVGAGGGTQGYLRLESAGAASREANIYAPVAGGLQIDTNSNGFPIVLNGSSIKLYPGASVGWDIGSTPHLIVSTDNTYDFCSAALRGRSGYFGTSISVGTTPATVGPIRLPNAQAIWWRDAANSADLNVVGIDGSDTVFLYGQTWKVFATERYLQGVHTRTITGAVTDGYTSALRLSPTYNAATAQTVTRHNYIDLEDVLVTGAGPAAVTDACALRFNAALGTHKATTALDKTANAKSGTIKVNVAGTLYHIQLYAA